MRFLFHWTSNCWGNLLQLTAVFKQFHKTLSINNYNYYCGKLNNCCDELLSKFIWCISMILTTICLWLLHRLTWFTLELGTRLAWDGILMSNGQWAKIAWRRARRLAVFGTTALAVSSLPKGNALYVIEQNIKISCFCIM